jgi:hypothetical protein
LDDLGGSWRNVGWEKLLNDFGGLSEREDLEILWMVFPWETICFGFMFALFYLENLMAKKTFMSIS